MYAVGIIFLFLIGYLTIFNLSTLTTRLERIGLAFPAGVGVMTVVMAVMDLVRIPLTATSLIIADFVVAALLVATLYPKRNDVTKAFKRPADGNFNFVWLLILAFGAWLEYSNFQKCVFFPTYDRDSLAAFDTLGFIAAQEHTYGAMSVFTGDYYPGIHAAGSPIAYFPLVQLAYAYVYSLGAQISKLIPALLYLSFLVSFYAILTRLTSRTAAMAATLFVLMTPEMTSFSALSGTNVVNAAYASLGMIYVLTWLGTEKSDCLKIGSLLLAFNVWSRAEGIVFVLIAIALVAVRCLHKRVAKPLIPIALTLVPVVLWQIFTRVFGMSVESFVIFHPFFDPEKINKIISGAWTLLSDTAHFGWTFPTLGLAFVADLWFIIKHRNNDLTKFVAIVSGIVLYFIVLYQVDYRWDSIDNVLSYSAKRFMFCFVPLAWYFVATCEPVKAFMTKFDGWMAK